MEGELVASLHVETHPASEIEFLTPRLWKEHFAGDHLHSDPDRLGNSAKS
jgi:hypothetical protein